MVEVLKQKQFKPMNVVDQVMILYAGTRGFLDKIPRNQVAAWEDQFLQFMREQKPEVRNTLRKERKLSPALEEQIKAAIEAFQHQFKPPSAGKF
jgi:F-type H+-transporting ATPase subunit alpha